MEAKKNKKRVVIALGGNALGKNLEEQRRDVKVSAKAIADLLEEKFRSPSLPWKWSFPGGRC